MRSINPVLKIFNSERKANSFLNGSKLIANEGFSEFKKRIKSAFEISVEDGLQELEELPGIGPTTKYHLAKNLGLADVAKPDIWLIRIAEVHNASVNELVGFLSETYQMSRHTVDYILWRYLADNGLMCKKG